MTRFEEIGVELQEQSWTPKEADRKFQRSCELCCSRGFHIRCDRCAIDCAHRRMKEVFSILKQAPHPESKYANPRKLTTVS